MSAKSKTAEQLATEHADERFPNASKYNAPFCTLAERWDDSHEDYLAGHASRDEEFDKLREISEWVPVEDQLPEANATVLFRCGVKEWHVGYHDGSLFIRKGYGDISDTALASVTHWRFIEPQKPKEKPGKGVKKK